MTVAQENLTGLDNQKGNKMNDTDKLLKRYTVNESPSKPHSEKPEHTHHGFPENPKGDKGLPGRHVHKPNKPSDHRTKDYRLERDGPKTPQTSPKPNWAGGQLKSEPFVAPKPETAKQPGRRKGR